MASQKSKQISVLIMSTVAFTVCFMVWMIFAVIGIPIKEQLGLNETQFGILAAMPVLTGSLSSFECVRDAVHDGGDHFLLVGRVIKAIFEPRRDPLLYFRGKYRKLHFA